MTDNGEFFKRAKQIQADYIELRKQGLIGLASEDVHLAQVTFFKLFADFVMLNRGDEKYPYRYEAIQDDVVYFCITTELIKDAA